MSVNKQVLASSGDISDGVSYLSLSKTDQAGRYLVQGEFSLQDVEEGQYIKINWNRAFSGINSRKDIKIGDLKVGELKVSNSEAKICFNQLAQNSHLLGGKFYFELLATEHNINDWKLTSGSKQVERTFSLKTSHFDRREDVEGVFALEDDQLVAKWQIRINAEQKEITAPIVLQSKLSDQQELSKVEFKVGQQNYSLSEFKQKFKNSKVELEDNQLKVSLDPTEFSKKTVELLQTAQVITDKQALKLELESDYLPLKKKVFQISSNKLDVELQQKNTGNLKINKVYRTKDGQYKALEGVEFEVFFKNKLLGTYLTDQNGQIIIKDLDFGTYKIKEVKAPDFVKFDRNKVWQVDVKNDRGEDLLVVNELKNKELKDQQNLKTANPLKEHKLTTTLFNTDSSNLNHKNQEFLRANQATNKSKDTPIKHSIRKTNFDREYKFPNRSSKNYSQRYAERRNHQLPKSGEGKDSLASMGLVLLLISSTLFAKQVYLKYKKRA